MRDWLNWVVRIASMTKGEFVNLSTAPQPLDRQRTAQSVSRLVHGGFAKFSEIEASIRDEQDTPLTAEDERWLDTEIRRQLKDKRREENDWPEETSWDRLNKVFKSLRRNGIIALHNAGFEESDGPALVEEAREASTSRSFEGFCFYHQQDIDAAIEHGGLALSYGSFASSPEAMRSVPEVILRNLREAGFAAEWSGNYTDRIVLVGFVWQKRSPRTTKARRTA